MNPQFEQSAEHQVSNQDDIEVFMRAQAKSMPTFTLIAQDCTASAIVNCWADAQRWIAQQVAKGRSLEDCLDDLGVRLGGVFAQELENESLPSQKVVGAYQRAHEMEVWPNKKLAD